MNTSFISPLASGWKDFTAVSGKLVSALASIRWWKDDGTNYHIKGQVVLQKRNDLFRLKYDGYVPLDTNKVPAFGALPLPQTAGWTIDQSKARSKHGATARLTTIGFPTGSDGLLRLQITVPFTGNGETEKLLGEALNFVAQQYEEAAKKSAVVRPQLSVSAVIHSSCPQCI